MPELDERIRSVLEAGDVARATTLALRELGPEILGFLSGVLGDADGDEAFSTFSVRLWRSLKGFEGRCSLRTWMYVLARQELGRFRRGVRRHVDGRVGLSELEGELDRVLRAVRTETRPTLAAYRRQTLSKLRDELPIEDRTLLILRVDRDLAWDDIALAFAEDPEAFDDADRRREAARLRKRFQLVKRKLVARARAVSDG